MAPVSQHILKPISTAQVAAPQTVVAEKEEENEAENEDDKDEDSSDE